jgi:hypothetical protein
VVNCSIANTTASSSIWTPEIGLDYGNFVLEIDDPTGSNHLVPFTIAAALSLDSSSTISSVRFENLSAFYYMI